jgi:hypothetical protein
METYIFLNSKSQNTGASTDYIVEVAKLHVNGTKLMVL